jgi:hypothetical protein
MSDDQERHATRWARGKRLVQMLSATKREERVPEQAPSTDRISINQLADLATASWRARKRAAKAAESNEESRRILRDLEGMFEIFQAIGIEIRDYTGETFDYGLPLKVITTQPVPGLAKEKVAETIKPTVFLKENLIQIGEVVIETPTESE